MILRLIVLSCLLWLSPNLALSATSLAEVQKAALSGDASAANRLGVWYEKGQNGLPKDPTQAVSWYRKAAKLGNILAMHNLGDCYLQQVGVAYDPAQAYAWYKMAAEAGGAMTDRISLKQKLGMPLLPDREGNPHRKNFWLLAAHV